MIRTMSGAVFSGGIGRLLCTAVVVSAGCATSEDLACVRQEIQDVRVKYEQSLSQREGKRKAAEELQGHLLKAFEAQAHTIAGLTSKVQDLQARQETLQQERMVSHSTHTLLRETILRSLKAEQADLEQRLRKMTEYIKDLERSAAAGSVSTPSSNTAPAAERSEKPSPEGPMPNASDDPRPSK